MNKIRKKYKQTKPKLLNKNTQILYELKKNI